MLSFVTQSPADIIDWAGAQLGRRQLIRNRIAGHLKSGRAPSTWNVDSISCRCPLAQERCWTEKCFGNFIPPHSHFIIISDDPERSTAGLFVGHSTRNNIINGKVNPIMDSIVPFKQTTSSPSTPLHGVCRPFHKSNNYFDAIRPPTQQQQLIHRTTTTEHGGWM